MDAQKDWKKKYQSIIDELEGKEKTWGSLEDLLRKTIGRLAIAGLGIDKKLDIQLKDIQTISRKKNNDKLSSALDRLSDVLNQIDTSHSKNNHQVKDELSTISEVMANLLDLLTPPEQYQSSFAKIRSHLEPETSDGILTTLASELNAIMSSSLQEQDLSEGESIDDVILALLDRLSIVPGMSQKAKSIQADIRKGLSLEQWPNILDHIAQEVSKALQSINDEKNELELFIAQVTEQLTEITGYISEDKKEQKDSLNEVEGFHLVMNKEVSKLHNNVETATDIQELKEVLGKNINVLKSNISSHLEKGKKRFTAAESRNEMLNKQIVHMESEADELKKRLEENKKKLIFDTLTGIRNRMAYNDHMKKLIARWQRYNEYFSYTILDIDHFKNVNDTYGHNTGDKVLKLVASIMQKNIRESDSLFRIGGEEFVLILPNTTTQQAQPIIDKLRNAVSNSGFRFKEEKITINLSAGLTQITKTDNEESLYERADKGLHKAKETGRNKLVIT